MSTELKDQITAAMKDAMRARDKDRLGTIRLIQAAIKQVEVDERIDVTDDRLLVILDKMVKQRKDSVQQFTDAGRTDLADKELAEIAVIQTFLPAPLSDDELQGLIRDAIAESGAAGPQDMGKVMAVLKPRIQGRADVGQASQHVKKLLAS